MPKLLRSNDQVLQQRINLCILEIPEVDNRLNVEVLLHKSAMLAESIAIRKER